VLIALGFAFIVAGIRPWRSTAPDIGTIPPTAAAPSSPAGPAAAAPAPSHTAAPFTPTRLRVLPLGVDAPVVPMTVQPDGLLAVPGDVDTIGWWSAGAAAAASSGTLVLVGHVDSAQQGPGALFGLRTLQPGDRVILSRGDDRTAAYTVAARREYPKSALPSGEVFGQHTTPRLVLVTCGGRFNQETHHYSDNIVVYAVPAPS
jgi:hypothetical protein